MGVTGEFDVVLQTTPVETHGDAGGARDCVSRPPLALPERAADLFVARSSAQLFVLGYAAYASDRLLLLGLPRTLPELDDRELMQRRRLACVGVMKVLDSDECSQ